MICDDLMNEKGWWKRSHDAEVVQKSEDEVQADLRWVNGIQVNSVWRNCSAAAICRIIAAQCGATAAQLQRECSACAAVLRRICKYFCVVKYPKSVVEVMFYHFEQHFNHFKSAKLTNGNSVELGNLLFSLLRWHVQPLWHFYSHTEDAFHLENPE